MGLFDKLIRSVSDVVNEVADDVEKGLTSSNDAVPVESVREEPAVNNCDNASDWPAALNGYPVWNLCPINDTSCDEGADYISVSIYVGATENMIQKYRDILCANGFSGSEQIQRKTINGSEYCVDFSFADPSSEDCEIHYVINK